MSKPSPTVYQQQNSFVILRSVVPEDLQSRCLQKPELLTFRTKRKKKYWEVSKNQALANKHWLPHKTIKYKMSLIT